MFFLNHQATSVVATRSFHPQISAICFCCGIWRVRCALLVLPLLSTVSSSYLQNCPFPPTPHNNFHSFLFYLPIYHSLLPLNCFSHSLVLFSPDLPLWGCLVLPHLQSKILALLSLNTTFLPPVDNCWESNLTWSSFLCYSRNSICPYLTRPNKPNHSHKTVFNYSGTYCFKWELYLVWSNTRQTLHTKFFLGDKTNDQKTMLRNQKKWRHRG